MNTVGMTLVMIPKETWEVIVTSQLQILQEINEIKKEPKAGMLIKNISAIDFMKAIGVKRTKFDQLVSENKIKIIKKKRKIYVPISEIDRYFNDASI
jgi:hypothetical protein